MRLNVEKSIVIGGYLWYNYINIAYSEIFTGKEKIMKKVISFIADGILAGFILSVSCAVNIAAAAPLGPFFFSLGLFAIITFKFGLYTGKAGYIVSNPPSYIPEVLLTLLGNFAGAAIGGTILRLTRFGEAWTASASNIITGKIEDSILSAFILAIFCSVLMYIAVDGSKRLREEKNYAGALFVIVMPIVVFITCGFNHSIADMGYFFLSGCAGGLRGLLYLAVVVLGNAVGCVAIPLVKKLSLNP